MKLGEKMTKEEYAIMVLAKAIEKGHVEGVVEEVERILLEKE